MRNKAHEWNRMWKRLGLFIVGLGFLGAFAGYFDKAEAKAKRDLAMSWPTVEGEVIRNEVKETRSVIRIRRIPTVGYTYEHTWSVRYEVEGKTHYREYRNKFDRRKSAYRSLKKRTKGAAVMVHYNPTRHFHAEVLDDGVESPAVALVFGGILSSIGGLMFWFFHRRECALQSGTGGHASKQTTERQQSDFAAVNLESAKYFRQGSTSTKTEPAALRIS